MWVFIKIVFIIAALIVFLRLKLNLTLAVFLTTVLTIFVFGMNVQQALQAAGSVLVESKTLQLFVIILMVLFIGSVLKVRGIFEKLIRSLNSFVGDKRAVALISPAIIGFLPSPGGALLSAPLVDVSTNELELRPEFRTFLNFWFRHFWEFIWPIYAGLLIFQRISEIPLRKIILYQSPFTVLNIVTGLIVVFHYFRKYNIRRVAPVERHSFRAILNDFIAGVWPLLLIIVLFFVFSLPLYLALTVVAIVMTVLVRLKPVEIVRNLFSFFIAKTLLLLAVVMIFQKVIIISDAFSALSTMNLTLPLIVFACFFVSFAMGFLTGVNTAYVVIAYPLLLPLIQGQPNFFYLSLYIYVIGFAGVLFSPVHLCLVLTNEYFKSSLIKVYRYLAMPVGTLVIVATLLVLLL